MVADETLVGEVVDDPFVGWEAQQYADYCNDQWQKSVTGIVQIGRALSDAKYRLPHGKFMSIFIDAPDGERIERPFVLGYKSGNQLVKIAQDPVISNVEHVRSLPASWGSLYQLTRFNDTDKERWIEDGTIHAGMQRSDINRLKIGRQRRDQASTIDYVGGADVRGDGWWLIRGNSVGDEHDDPTAGKLGELAYDAIVTDPPYPHDLHYLWSRLAAHAARGLPDGGLLITLTGKMALPEIIRRLEEHLDYGWMYCSPRPGSSSRIGGLHVNQEWKPWLVYKPPGKAWPGGRVPHHGDMLEPVAKDKGKYDWQQGTGDAEKLIDLLVPVDGIVVDPFMGVGSYGVAALNMGRRFIGIEADAERFDQSVERLRGV